MEKFLFLVGFKSGSDASKSLISFSEKVGLTTRNVDPSELGTDFLHAALPKPEKIAMVFWLQQKKTEPRILGDPGFRENFAWGWLSMKFFTCAKGPRIVRLLYEPQNSFFAEDAAIPILKTLPEGGHDHEIAGTESGARIESDLLAFFAD